MKGALSLTVLLVAKCTRQGSGSVILRSSLMTALLNGGKEEREVLKKQQKLDCPADHVSSSTLVRFVPRFYHLLMEPSHTVFTQWS